MTELRFALLHHETLLSRRLGATTVAKVSYLSWPLAGRFAIVYIIILCSYQKVMYAFSAALWFFLK